MFGFYDYFYFYTPYISLIFRETVKNTVRFLHVYIKQKYIFRTTNVNPTKVSMEITVHVKSVELRSSLGLRLY